MQERFKIHPLWRYICEAQFSNLVKPHSGTSDQSNQSPSQPAILTNSQSGQLSNHSVGQRVISQLSNSQSRQLSYPLTVSQESCLIIQLVDKKAVVFSYSQSKQLSNHSAGQQVVSHRSVNQLMTIGHSVYQLDSQSLSRWVSHYVNQSVKSLVNRSVSKQVSQSVTESVSQHVSLLVSQWSSWSPIQSVNKSVSQLISQ